MKIKVNEKFMEYLVAHRIKLGFKDKKTRKRKGAKASNKDTVKKLKKNYVYYGMLACMIVISIASVSLAIKTYGKFNQEDYNYYADNGKEVDSGNIASDNTSSINESSNNASSASADVIDKGYEKPIESSIVGSSNVAKEETTPVVKKEEEKPKVPVLSFTKPVAGEISKPYSPDVVVFWATLNTWKTHEGMDIKAEKGTAVKAVEAGTVESIKNDPLFGTTVIIDHGQGYKSIYCNLDTGITLKAKDNVKKSQTIGKVGDSAIGEIKEDSHLHFEFKLNGKIVDPTKYIKF